MMDAARASVDADPAFRADVLAGLAAPVRAVPARWLYDRAGSEWFERITGLPEYYPTRTEVALLKRHCPDIAAVTGTGGAVIEFGSGSSTKTPILLNCVHPAAYVPIDISGDFLRDAAASLQEAFPALPIHPVEADFMKPIQLPRDVATLPKLGFFPGSTIGNMVPRTAVDLLRAMKDTLGDGAFLLIGMDRIKDVSILIPAYDDAQGVTAAFNLNLLHRINRELKGTIPVGAFRHRALWNDGKARIEMHLEALEDVDFTVEGRPFAMTKGETIHTENSHKYGPRDARLLLHAAGWGVRAEYTDEKDQFALLLAEAEPPRFAP
ncbi:L-histidine N(alpha)-methyltransferase [Allosphingosinicella flava]|uniref:L-histidine N(Alpha)-methyltransferase n=1 Tax=Allosphingosinicella flava TaxID=2771430 RepID=A0A7T2LLN5_9SPHN|nr:L-histidine N(alpha)-methyltransferase [Sphingosinicella flava]QPQ54624.1 L-histidine N(alpha)-methyltransferase [Sphingosinicella flava]